jgi:hypothetical protein
VNGWGRGGATRTLWLYRETLTKLDRLCMMFGGAVPGLHLTRWHTHMRAGPAKSEGGCILERGGEGAGGEGGGEELSLGSTGLSGSLACELALPNLKVGVCQKGGGD